MDWIGRGCWRADSLGGKGRKAGLERDWMDGKEWMDGWMGWVGRLCKEPISILSLLCPALRFSFAITFLERERGVDRMDGNGYGYGFGDLYVYFIPTKV